MCQIQAHSLVLWVVDELFPFMVSEMMSKEKLETPLLELLLESDDVHKILSNLPTVLLGSKEQSRRDAFETILQWGGMPSLRAITSDRERQKWLKDYEYTYLERDLMDLARIQDLHPFRKFQSLAAMRSGRLMNYSELARDSGLSVDTAKRYFEYLRLSYQSFFLTPYFANSTKALIKTPKLFWIDIGMLRQATKNWGPPDGELFETAVVSEIYKWIKTNESNASLYFYRTQGGLECDLLLETPKGVLGFEIKYREKVYSKDFSSLNHIRKNFPKNWLGSIVIYNGHSIEKLPGDNTWAIPAWRLLT